MEDDEIAIVFVSHLDFGAVARQKATIVIDPETDRRIVLGGHRGPGRRASQQQRKEQRGDHGTSQQTR